jgi:hypothetical protein
VSDAGWLLCLLLFGVVDERGVKRSECQSFFTRQKLSGDVQKSKRKSLVNSWKRKCERFCNFLATIALAPKTDVAEKQRHFRVLAASP